MTLKKLVKKLGNYQLRFYSLNNNCIANSINLKLPITKLT